MLDLTRFLAVKMTSHLVLQFWRDVSAAIMMSVTITLSVPQRDSAAAIRLRPWRLDDLPSLVAAHRDPELHRWLTTSLVDEANARDWLAVQAVGWADATRFSY
ncbi:GNAT family N-acetyltransferase [Nocardia brasiliensis]|uniref:GNAT family N-acetyltransferase n=1 Tax=Nocardia brasiliensis TaxID=37326 RepID=UPI00366AFDEB